MRAQDKLLNQLLKATAEHNSETGKTITPLEVLKIYCKMQKSA